MDWIRISSRRQRLRPRRSIVEEVESLNLKEKEAQGVSFNEESFKVRILSQTFKNYCFTDLTPPDCPGPVVKEFMLLLKTQYEQVDVVLTATVNTLKECIKYCSYPVKHAHMLQFSRQQATALGRLFSLHLNSRVSLGWLSLDPDSGSLTYQHANNSLGFLEKRIERVPEELAAHMLSEVREIEKNWRQVLPDIFGLLNLQERRNLAHPFWKLDKPKRNPYDSPEFSFLSEYVRASFVEYPEMFDREKLKDLKPGKRIRSRELSREEKNTKHLTFKNQLDSMNY